MGLHSAPHSSRQMGRPGFWDQGRQLLWSWWLWTLIAIVAASADHWRMAIATTAAAVVTYLTVPHEHSPKYGLESRFSVPSDEFLNSLVGATGVPFLPGNRVKILNNGDEFYPEMLAAIQGATHSITMEAYIYWKGEVGKQFA